MLRALRGIRLASGLRGRASERLVWRRALIQLAHEPPPAGRARQAERVIKFLVRNASPTRGPICCFRRSYAKRARFGRKQSCRKIFKGPARGFTRDGRWQDARNGFRSGHHEEYPLVGYVFRWPAAGAARAFPADGRCRHPRGSVRDGRAIGHTSMYGLGAGPALAPQDLPAGAAEPRENSDFKPLALG